MNSHIVEKTMHSIKNIDRLTDLAAIDVYNTTHDTINKYEIMKEHATEEYTNESFYQESVLAGVLIGAGVLGVAISAFFIIKKIIDTKAAGDSSVKSSDGKPVAANVDLRDPKSAEKYKSAVAARIESLSDSTQIKIAKKVNTEAFNATSKQIEDIVTSLQSIIDNKSDADEISKVINGMKLEAIDLGKVVENVEETTTKANFINAIGLDNMISLAKLVKDLEDKINGVEKTVNQKGANKKDGENTVEVPDDVMKKLKNDTKVNQNIIDALLTSARSFMETTDASVVGAAKIETEAKNKTEEAKSTAGTDSDTPKNANPQAQSDETATPVAQNSGQNIPPSSTPKNLNFQASGFNNGKPAEPKSGSELADDGSSSQKQPKPGDPLYLHTKIPEGSNDKANAQTLNEIINMLKSGKSDKDAINYLKLNNYSEDQIKDFLAKAKDAISGPKNKIIQALTAKGKSPTIAQNIANEICDKYNNDLVQYMNAQIAANPGNDKSATWAKNEAYKNCMIIADAIGVDKTSIPKPDESVSEPSESEEETKTPEEPKKDVDESASKDTQTENSEYPDDVMINENPELKEDLINDLANYMKQYPDESDDEAFQVRGFNTLKISPEMAKELKTSARELANKGTSEPEKKPEDQVKTEPENPPTSADQNNNNTTQVTYGNDGEIIINGKNTGIKKSWSDDMNDRAEKMISYLLENNYKEIAAAKNIMSLFINNKSGDLKTKLERVHRANSNDVKANKLTPEQAEKLSSDWYTLLIEIARGLGEDENFPPAPDFKALVPSENNADKSKSENENKEKSKPTASDFENFKNPEANPESQQRFNSEINNADKSSTQSVQSDEAALRQAALNRQAEVSSEPEKVAIADEDVKNLITFSNIPENFANDISKTITDDINNNTPFDVQHIKDIATNLSKENGEDFAVNAKQIQKVFRDMAAACKPQTDAVKQYIDAIDKTDINSLKPQEASAPVDNKPQLSPEEMTDQIVNNINQIPTSAINNANALVSSSYDDATKQQIAKEVISKLQSSGQTAAAGSFASSLKTSLGYTDADLNSSELPLYGSEKGTYEPLTGKNQAMNMISNNPVDNGMIETVARLRNEGLDDDQIRQKLLAANWKPELIEGMLQKVNNIEVQNNPSPTSIPNQTGVINVDAAAENVTPQNAQNNESIQYNISKALNDYKSTPFAQRHVDGLSAYGLENEVNNIITRAQSLRNTGIDPAKSITMREAFNNLWKRTGGGFGIPSKDKKKALEAAKEYTKLRMTEAGVGDFFQEMFALDSEYRKLIQECDIAIIREEKLKLIQEQQTDPEE